MSEDGSLLSKLRQAQPDTAAGLSAEQKKAAAQQTESQTAQYEVSYEISEADIQKNPVYQIITDESLSLKERADQVAKLKAYNPEITPEENAANLQAIDEVILYHENQVLTLAQRQTQFSNDEAFSLFDETIQKLQDNLHLFKSNIEPLVDAFSVIEKARAQGIPPNQLLREVQDMKDKKASLENNGLSDIDEKIRAKDQEIEPISEQAREIQDQLSSCTKTIEQAENQKAQAQETLDTEQAKFFLRRNSQLVERSKGQIESAQSQIKTTQATIDGLKGPSSEVQSRLDKHTQELDDLKSQREKIVNEISELDQSLNSDADTVALAKLLEITGSEFKDKRQELVQSVEDLITDSVKDFERSMSRFESGRQEVSVMLATVENIGELNGVLVRADKMAREQTTGFIAEQQSTVEKIKAEKGDAAYDDPAFEKARQQNKNAVIHSDNSEASTNRAQEFANKLTGQQTTYTGLVTTFGQKFQDAKRLRTNAAVDVSSKLLTTTKSLEMAIASERTSTTDDILEELSQSALTTTKGIFDRVRADKTMENQRLEQVLRQSLETAEAIDSVTRDLKEQARDSHTTRAAIDEMRGTLDGLNDGLRGFGTDAVREIQAEGLGEAVTNKAMQVAQAGSNDNAGDDQLRKKTAGGLGAGPGGMK